MRALAILVLLLGVAHADDVEPPKSATPVVTVYGGGERVYKCTKGAWHYKTMAANLLDEKGADFGAQAGDVWTALDGSKVTGKLVKLADAPREWAIPWALFSATSKGKGVLAGIKFVKRDDTVFGLVFPKCTEGNEHRAQFAARYTFYK